MIVMRNAALVTVVGGWMEQRYPRQPFDAYAWDAALTAPVNQAGFRDLELRTVLADWHLDRAPYPSEVRFRLRRGREGVQVADTVTALRRELAVARERRDADPDGHQAHLVEQRQLAAVGVQSRLPLPRPA